MKASILPTAKFSTALKSLGTNIAITAAIDLAIKAFTYLYNIQDKLDEKTSELTDTLKSQTNEFDSLTSELDSVNQKLKDNEERYDELIKKQHESALTIAESQELEELQNISAELTNQKNVLEENIKLKKESAAATANELADTLLKQQDTLEFFEKSGENIEKISNTIISVLNYFEGLKILGDFKLLGDILTNISTLLDLPDDHWLTKTANVFNGKAVGSFLTGTDLTEDSYNETVRKYKETREKMEEIRKKYDDNGDGIIDSDATMAKGDKENYKKYYDDASEYAEKLQQDYQEIDDAIKAIEADPNLSKVEEEDLKRLRETQNIIAEILGYEKEPENTKRSFDNEIGGSDSEIVKRLRYLTQQFEAGKLTYKEYFDSLQNEIDNVDFSNYTDSLEEANSAAQQFFTDSMQQTTTGLSNLINEFDTGNISITEYLEGYVSIAQTLSSLTDSLQENSASWNANGKAIDDATSKALDDTQSKLDSAINTIASYQDSIYSLEQIMTQSVEVGSDEFSAHAQVIAQDLYNIVQTGGLMAEEISNVLGTTTDEIAQNLTQSVSNQSLAAQAISANTNVAITNMATAVGELFDSLGNAISNFKMDITFGLKSITSKTMDLGVLGKVQVPAIKFGIEAGGDSLSAIGDAVSSFGKSVASNFTSQTIDINDYLFGNTETGKDSNYTPGNDILNNYNNTLNNIKNSGKETSKVFDWIPIAIERVQHTITTLGNTVSATWKSWNVRNNALRNELSAITNEIDTQQTAYRHYLSLAESVGLPEPYKTLVQNGAVNISKLTDETLINQIEKYQEYYEKALSAYDAKLAAENSYYDTIQTNFDNLAKQYNNQISLIQHDANMLNSEIEMLEKQGQVVSKDYYNSLIQNANQQMSTLQTKYRSLQSAMGSIAYGTEMWYSMNAELLAINEEMKSLESSTIDWNNAIRDLEWENFDRALEKMAKVNDKADFLKELLSNEDMFHEDGSITKEGLATMALHAVNYNSKMEQANKINKELRILDEEYAGNEDNLTYLERRNELEQQYQDLILDAKADEQSLIDMQKDQYDALLDYMSELIDKRKNMLSQAKDMYDYEKNIKEQAEEVAKLEKQLSAYQGDTSEESRATIQQIKVSLEDAKENLQETQYEKYISDQEQMLDALYDETEEWLNARLDDENLLLESILAAINNNAGLITDTLEGVAFGVGTTLPSELADSLTTVNAYNQQRALGNVYTDYLAQAQNMAGQLQFSLPTLATYDASAATSRGVGDITINGLSLEFPNVQTPEEWVTYLQHDKRFENIILEITDGNNSLSKYKW